MSVAAIVLAAGRGRRFGPDGKLAAMLGGKPLVRHVAETAIASRAKRVIVVTGFAAREVCAALDGLEFAIVHNADHARGMAGSLKAGVAALPTTTSGALVLLADMPLVGVETLDKLIATFEDENASPDAVVPVYEGQRGNPVLIGRTLFAEIAALAGDAGARALLSGSSHAVRECQVCDPGVLIDVDSADRLMALELGRL